ncbi:MAG TPA: M20/M25/M40 family metallo-hydrolase [Rhizomicrobium sp.]|jgi:acetylornithine deacetylase/succinyl-diaminopimelate desuccinylase-like protein
MMRRTFASVIAMLMATSAFAQDISPDKARFRALYKELVETNTTLSSGSCTLAAERMAAHLKAAGYSDSDLHLFTAPDHPKEGGLVAVLPGSDPKAKAILLLAHIDVVEARREDWTRDPFQFIEEGGYFYGRGTSDMKAQAAVWVDTLVRLKEEGFRHTRTIKMALTCGEETSTAFNGASWLATHERQQIDAEFALNEGGGGRLDASGKPLALTIQAGEKFPQNYQLEVTNPGGHSSRPTRDNAIYHLAGGLLKIQAYEFPIQTTDATIEFFHKMAPQVGGETGAAMTAFAKDPQDAHAIAVLSADPGYNGIIHTTCIPTLLSGGHANNAQPQRADANINCRIFPGTTVEQVRDKLQELVSDPKVKVTIADKRSEVTKVPPPLTPQIMKPVEQVAAKIWPGVPIVPTLLAGATDGAFLTPAGIPTYGLSGMFGDPDGNGAHGLNERLRVSSVYKGRDFLYEVVKIYANQK